MDTSTVKINDETNKPEEVQTKNPNEILENNEDKQSPIALDLDTILVEELGQFGLYQLKTLVLAAIVVIFSGWHAEYIFTAARIDTRCVIPECENPAEHLEFAPSWILNAIPGTTGTSFDNCQRFANVSSTVEAINDICPKTLFDWQSVVSCEEYVYENTNTVVYDYGLACDEWRRSLIGSIRTAGTLLALPLTGFISDRWGRRTALALNAFNTAWLGLVRYWAATYIGFTISQFTEAALGSGVFSCVYILLMELVGPKYRVLTGAFISSCFAVGQASLGLIAWAVPYWRTMTLVIYVPQLVVTASYFWLLSESVRWYMSKGRYEESEKVLKEIARVNKKQLSDKSLQALRQTAEEEKKRKEFEEAQQIHEPLLVVQVFRNKAILIRCAVTPVWWITTTFIYYGLTINSVNISGNQYINYVTVALVEIPGFFLAYVLMSRIGRKPVLMGAFWVCAACQIGYIFIPDGLYGVSLTVYLIGKASIATVVTAIYVYTVELYPTKYRHRLFAFSSMMGRFGSILAPLTPAFGDTLPFILYACLALLSGSLVFFTPETLGSKFPDTMEEATQMGKQQKNNI